MIESIAELREWLVCAKLPVVVASNPLAMAAWERALSDPTAGKIRAFCVLSCVELWADVEINWGAVSGLTSHQGP